MTLRQTRERPISRVNPDVKWHHEDVVYNTEAKTRDTNVIEPE